MLYDRMDGVPDPGSPMEILFLVLWRMRQTIEFQKSRVVIQALLSQQGAEGKQIEGAFKDLREAFFPFEKSQKESEIASMKQVMARELSRGPMKVTPMVDLTRTKVQQKLVQGQAALSQRAELLRAGRLTTLDKAPLEEARHRKRVAASLTKGGSVGRHALPMISGRRPHSPA